MKTVTIREDFLIQLLKEEHEAGMQNMPGFAMQKAPMEWVTGAFARMQKKLERDLRWVEETTLSTRSCAVLKSWEIRSPAELAARIGELEDSDNVSTRTTTGLKEWLLTQDGTPFGPTPTQQKAWDDLPPFITQALGRNSVGLKELIRMDNREVIRLSGIGEKARRLLMESGLLRKR